MHSSFLFFDCFNISLLLRGLSLGKLYDSIGNSIGEAYEEKILNLLALHLIFVTPRQWTHIPRRLGQLRRDLTKPVILVPLYYIVLHSHIFSVDR